MALSEGVQARLVYKTYASPVLSASAEAVPATAPAATGGTILRRVSHGLNMRKNTFRSNEIRTDRQMADFRHGSRRVEGPIAGELSGGTYWPFLVAAMRGVAVAPLADSNVEFTSVTSDSTSSTFTFTGGDPSTEGYRVGDVIRFTNLATAANNNVNFVITGLSGTSNRIVAVTPAPVTDAVADSAFNLARPGSTIHVPSSAFTSYLFAFEDYAEDIDVARLFTECRITGFRIRIPAEGMATIEFGVLGRGMTVLTAGSAPFFASPAAATTSNIAAGANGVMRVGGVNVGVVTGLEIDFQMAAEAPAVVGQVFPPEIFLGMANVTGRVTGLVENETLLNAFLNETESSIIARCDTSGVAGGNTIGIHLPRLKFGAADIARTGETSQSIDLPFQALKYVGSGVGIEQTSIRIQDTTVV